MKEIILTEDRGAHFLPQCKLVLGRGLLSNGNETGGERYRGASCGRKFSFRQGVFPMAAMKDELKLTTPTQENCVGASAAFATLF